MDPILTAPAEPEVPPVIVDPDRDPEPSPVIPEPDPTHTPIVPEPAPSPAETGRSLRT
jgi:hypothetical protein